jgi:hypothetical protein
MSVSIATWPQYFALPIDYCATYPPSIINVSPVMNDAMSDDKNRTALATSSGVLAIPDVLPVTNATLSCSIILFLLFQFRQFVSGKLVSATQ